MDTIIGIFAAAPGAAMAFASAYPGLTGVTGVICMVVGMTAMYRAAKGRQS